jgi:hypothetical protein
MKENPRPVHVPPTNSVGQHNDFSQQEAEMSATAMPPSFALMAGAAAPAELPNGDTPTEQQQGDLQALGLHQSDIATMDAAAATRMLAASQRFAPEEWQRLLPALKRHGLLGQMPNILYDFYIDGNWLTSESAVSLEVLEGFSYTNGEGKRMGGFLELAREGNRVGIRAIVPYDDFGKAVILNPKKTTTVLGRFVDAAKHPDGFQGAMNMPIGTNFFRFQDSFEVGKNTGGGNVLDIADWSWAKNNAWLQAAIDRGDIIRFVSDPTLKTSLFKKGNGIEDGLTVFGKELGVLLNRGLAPDPSSGIVAPCDEIKPSAYSKDWILVRSEVAESGDLANIDAETYQQYLSQTLAPVLAPVETTDDKKNVIATQSNFFGGKASQNKFN